jgi:hypothetical protein
VLDGSKHFIDGKLFAQRRLPFQPQVFERILLGGMSKEQARDFPARFRSPRILLGKKALHIVPPMITRALPQQHSLLVWIERLTPLQIGHRIDAIPAWPFLQVDGLGPQIDRAIVRLSLAFVRHRYPNRRIPLPPHHPTDIAPH